MNLAEIIIQRIKTEGPISFRDYMDMALYYPDLGYYTLHNKIGATGDFYTSANISPAFGAMIARQLEEMWVRLGSGEFTIVEYGAGSGSLCHDILNYLKANKKLYEQLRYCIIETSPVMRQMERAHLHDKVSWHESILELSGFVGCVLSNELIDNIPVHQVVQEEQLMEVFVDYQNNFVELLKPAGNSLKDYFKELNVQLPKDYRTEVNLEAIEWIREISSSLKQGYVITIDYGYPSAELYSYNRREGTLLCYHKHQINDQPYIHIGEQDITAHVNFSALSYWGNKLGLKLCGFTTQANFLLALGFKKYVLETDCQDEDLIYNARKEAFLTQALIIDMGLKFKVLIQGKNTDGELLRGLEKV